MPRFQFREESITSPPSSTRRSPGDWSEMICSTSNDAGEVSFSCSSRHCKSCSAVFLADSVAVCCCPLAIISLLALAFVKVPYMVGKKCLRLRSRRKRRQTKMMKCWKDQEVGAASGSDRNDNLLIYRSQRDNYDLDHNKDIVFEFREGKVVVAELEVEEERKSLCGGFEQAERFFMELYQVGQLGFGRVSFTGAAQSSYSSKSL